MRSRTIFVQGVLVALVAIYLLAVLGCDDCPTGEVGQVYWDFSELEIRGQSLYPERPESDEYDGFTAVEGGDDWDCHLAMVREPADNPGVCWVVVDLNIEPPYCEPGALARYCAWVFMDQFIVGPKSEGEVYQVEHHRWRDVGMPHNDTPAVYASWTESGWGFPAYESVDVSGTATVISERPFLLAFDVVFSDADGNLREVTLLESPRYFTYCENN